MRLKKKSRVDGSCDSSVPVSAPVLPVVCLLFVSLSESTVESGLEFGFFQAPLVAPSCDLFRGRVFACACVRACACVCVCVCMRARACFGMCARACVFSRCSRPPTFCGWPRAPCGWSAASRVTTCGCTCFVGMRALSMQTLYL